MLARAMMAVATLSIVLWAPAALSSGSACRDACYHTKSLEYQRCRTIPPTDRATRVRCFQAADQALQRCLRSCK